MNIEKLLVIPQLPNIDEYIQLSKEYHCGFEYNDFFLPDILDDADTLEERIYFYKNKEDMPEYVTLHGVFLDITIFSDDSRIKAVSDFRVEQSIDVARQLGVNAVIFHTNYVDNFKLRSYREDWVNKNFAYWSEKANKYPDINFYMENMFDSDWELLLKLAEKMKDYSNFGVCFDYSHAHVFGDENKIRNWVINLAPYVKHIHINDCDYKEDAHLALGDGQIDWQQFKQYYEKYFSSASVLIEVKGVDNTRKSLEFLRKL